MANELREIFTKTGKQEQHRQVHNMRVAQDREIQSIEEAQKIQYFEFAKNWDKFMQNYE